MVSYRDANKDFGEIEVFSQFPEVNSIRAKVTPRADFTGLDTIVVSRTAYRLTDLIHQDYPEAKSYLSKGHLYDTIQHKPQELVDKLEHHKAEEEKRSIEDDVRARLRGFSRTIPSFIMAYGDGHLTLRNFDEYTEDDVFQEVTGITLQDFRFLRDGGDYTDENGETQHFAGQLFDEVVFDDSVGEFWRLKLELADYFDESKDEDIFDYIPPQKTNQIFTPRWVVQKMVDELEKENPGCFDDPSKTFADLYMKSGLYITEIVKRLYRSERMKELFPGRQGTHPAYPHKTGIRDGSDQDHLFDCDKLHPRL